VVPDREIFLGLWKGAPCFAVEVEGSVDPAAGPLAGLGAFHEIREAAAMCVAKGVGDLCVRPTDTALAATAYSSTSAHPTVQASSSPMVA